MRTKTATRGRYKRCPRCSAMLRIGGEFCPHCGLHMPISFPHNPLVAADAERVIREVADGATGAAPWATPGRYLIIVARERKDLFDYFAKVFAHELNVRVVQERRAAERRQRGGQPGQERRWRDRRRRPALPELGRFGFAIVKVG
ncbi:MAG: zinc ribbon domain-containing protein [Candidatus Rokubacteria bacterium]|nr:zinc ribbon domain-containing protein [Candidatus Rokubacteria bacterium]